MRGLPTFQAVCCRAKIVFSSLFLVALSLVTSSGCGELQASAQTVNDEGAATINSPVLQGIESRPALACDLAGIWVAQWKVAVQWKRNLGLVGGEGYIEHRALIHRTKVADGTWLDEAIPCGLYMPSYESLPLFGSERYAMAVEDAVFDRKALRAARCELHYDESQSEAAFFGGPYVFELGVALDDPGQQPWPENTDALAPYLRDHDEDGGPGISMVAKTDGYVQPAVNMRRTRRAESFYVAMRHSLAARGKVVDCDTLIASDVALNSSSVPKFESRTLGCRLTDGDSCTSQEASLATRYAPKYRVGDGSRVIYRRINEAQANCAAIRAMAF